MRRWLRWPWALLLGVLTACVTLRPEKSTDEVFIVGETSCEFSFGVPKGEWTGDPNSAAYANIPVMVRKSELGTPTLFLSMNRFWRDEKSPGGWSRVTEEKCQLANRDVVRTSDGKEARVFLASSCDVSGAMREGRIASPFREHTLYGYVVYNDKEADFLYLSSSDQALVHKHEDVFISALKSYSTSSANCVARRTTVKKLEIARLPEKAAGSEQSANTVVRRPASGIHPDFIQNLNNQVSNSQSSDSISSMAYDPKNDFLLIGRESGAVDIWDGRQANARRAIKAHKMRASQLSFSSDGRMFFSNSYFEDVTHVWDAASGSLFHTIERSRGPVVETSDPNLFVVASSSGLRIFNLAAKEVLPDTYRQVGDVVTALAYDVPTDQLAIGTASGGVEIWRLLKVTAPTLERIAVTQPYAVGNWVKAVQFFDSGRALYSLPERGNLDEWSVPKLEPLRSREISLRFVGSSVFIPEKGRLAMMGFRKGDNADFSGFLETFNLGDGGESLVDLKESGSGVMVYLPSLSTIIAGKGSAISVIDIAKAR